MSITLTQANNQWSSRPADERFGSLDAMHKAALNFRTTAAVANIKANALRVAAAGNDHVNLALPTAVEALLGKLGLFRYVPGGCAPRFRGLSKSVRDTHR